MATAYNAAVRIGDKIPELSAANAMSTAFEDTGPRNRTSRSLFARRYAKVRTQVSRNNDFRSGCQRATSMLKRGSRYVRYCSFTPQRVRKKTVVTSRIA